MLPQAVKCLASKLPSTTISVKGTPYLTRHYVLLKDWKFFNIYIHHFHTSDQGDELHNHPWKWALSYIVSGGYKEEFRKNDEVYMRVVLPNTFHTVKHNVFHRVDLFDTKNGAWSIFFAGPRITKRPEWGFWDRNTKKFKDWRDNPEAIA